MSSIIWTVTQQEVLYEEVLCSNSGQTVPVIQEGVLELLWSKRTVFDHSWWGIWNQTAAAKFFIGNVGTLVKNDWEEECHLLTKSVSSVNSYWSIISIIRYNLIETGLHPMIKCVWREYLWETWLMAAGFYLNQELFSR